MEFLLQTINILADLLTFLIFARVIFSWFIQDPGHMLMKLLIDLTEPILKPLRRALPRFGVFDISPIVALFLIELIRKILNSALL